MQNAARSTIIVVTGLLSFALGFLLAKTVYSEKSHGAEREHEVPARIGTQEMSALSGDVASSQALVMKADDCIARSGGNSKECLASSAYWLQIDAENGGGYGTYVLFMKGLNSKNCADLARAIFWRGKLIEGGKDGSSLGDPRKAYAERCK